MDFLVEATNDLFLNLEPNYDSTKQTFILDSQKSRSGDKTVRIIENKLLPAKHPPNAFGGGSHTIDPANPTRTTLLYDSFSGIIDGISGDLLHGNRSYVLTGEEYEGPFHNNIRHGEGAIVKNVYLPSIRYRAATGEGPRYYGAYKNDSPSVGTLVMPACYSYHGPFLNSRPHGEKGTMIHSSGLKYEGGFRYGSYHGNGTETNKAVNEVQVYTGEFNSGVRQGNGTYGIYSHSDANEDGDVLNGSNDPSRNDNIEPLHTSYKYQGQWSENQKQGEGEELTSNGEIYRGQFHSNERHGYGMLTFKVTQPDSTDLELSTYRQNATIIESSKILISAEGIWRAGIPLDGTYGWTLTYQNGDIYTGFASKFVPNGYGVKRSANKDIYSGEWKDGNREGEGIFIAASRREEYIGTWKDDKIVPTKEGKDDSKRVTLTDLTLSLLSGNGNDITSNSNMVQTPGVTEDKEISVGPEHHDRRELLEKVMRESLSTSLELLLKSSDQSHRDNSWLFDNSSPSDSKDSANLYGNAVTLMEMNRIAKVSFGESDTENDTGCEEIDAKSDTENSINVPQSQLINYPNGDSYCGEICSETKNRDGYGVYLSCATGSTYSGGFRQGPRHGYGILVHTLGKYCGDFVDDEKHGMGTLILNDSSSYFGEFSKGEIHGRGTLCEKSGTVYVGEWVNGVRNGDGYETLADGRVYMGEYLEGKKHGVGTMQENAGGPVIYSGSWSEGLYHGEGVARRCVIAQNTNSIISLDTSIDPDKKSNSHLSTVQYEGSFFRGHLDGFGTLTYNTVTGCVVAKGNWRRNAPVPGKWRIQFGDGSIYSGEAKSEEMEGNESLPGRLFDVGIHPNLSDYNITTPIPDGFGTMKYAVGDLFIGNFFGGKRHGIGTCEFKNGDCWEGEWKNDSMDIDGAGIMTWANGQVKRYYKREQ